MIRGDNPMFKRILVAVDGSDTSNQALLAALELARDRQSHVRLLHVLDELSSVHGYRYSAQLREMAQEAGQTVLDDARAIAAHGGIEADTQLVDAPGQRLGDVVADAARAWAADLVVVGTHGRRGVGRVLLGSGAEEVVRMAAVPVLTVRGGAAAR
jgi:nucleotide-binding universal stress UspA family protein